MKKILVLLLSLFILFGCSAKSGPKPDFDSGFEVECYDVDMSAYDGITSINHKFKQIQVSEMFRTIDEKGYGVFYLGYRNCRWCQSCLKYLNQVAMDLDVTIYYIDAKSEQFPLSESDYDNLLLYLDPVLMLDEDGEKSIFTPHIFSVINGEIVGSQISTSGNETWDVGSPSDGDVQWLKDKYFDILMPFVH